jgi:hypothetical protein
LSEGFPSRLAGDDREEEAADFFQNIQTGRDDFAQYRAASLIPGYALSHRAQRILENSSAVLTGATRITLTKICPD